MSSSGGVVSNLRKALRRRDRPSIFGPNYLHLYTLVRELRAFLRDQGGRTLDLGADESPYRGLLARETGYFRLDLDLGCKPDIAADITRLPVTSDCIDLIVCTQAIEFITDPRDLVAECHRVLKPGGTVVLSAPFFWPNQPSDYDNYRFSITSMRRLFADFSTVEIRPAGNCWVTLAQVASRCLYATLGAAGVPLYLAINVAGRLLDWLPSDASLTTGYVVRAVKPRAR